ncbi:hypothetical protein QTO34_003890 [Cnephaeus nilssonii]|uniref:Uncharacterized protein n=1 Tax=Cnephaeus nilssonii TaxID=3371016 RepID=A0AA40LKA5_CNENI|nr:hypothetical protein QTO34_003890 [Eptesicus nilssonii]
MYLAKEALEQKDREDFVPFTGEKKERVFIPKEKPVEMYKEDKVTLDPELEESLASASDTELYNLAAVLGEHNLLNNPKCDEKTPNTQGGKGPVKNVVKGEAKCPWVRMKLDPGSGRGRVPLDPGEAMRPWVRVKLNPGSGRGRVPLDPDSTLKKMQLFLEYTKVKSGSREVFSSEAYTMTSDSTPENSISQHAPDSCKSAVIVTQVPHLSGNCSLFVLQLRKALELWTTTPVR